MSERHKNKKNLRRLAGTMALLFATCAAADAQGQRTSNDGVFTAAQAARGKTLYFDQCIACHGGELQGVEDNPPLTGKPFWDHWAGRPVAGLFSFINHKMPPGNGGALGAQGDIDVVAFILAENGGAAGQAELPTDPKVLATIVFKPDLTKK